MTLYAVRIRYKGGKEVTATFESATARALALIMIAPYVDILELQEVSSDDQ